MGNFKIGVPRALLYYEYSLLWIDFLEGLGAEVIVSSPTTKELLDLGVKSAISEVCLPVKVFYGHVMSLKDKVDFLFVPRMVCVEKGAYFCPKFLGLPDMLKSSLSPLPPLIEPTIDVRKSATNFKNAFLEVGKSITSNSKKIYCSFIQAQKNFWLYSAANKLEEGDLNQLQINQPINKSSKGEGISLNVALIGHSYLLDDSFVNLNLISKLKKAGVNILTAEMVSKKEIEKQLKKLYKPLFWTLSKKTVGAALYFLEKKIDGIIHLSTFECGEDSLVGEIIRQESHKYPSVAYTEFVFDEHTGEAGINTRTEAFLDMIIRRKIYESNHT